LEYLGKEVAIAYFIVLSQHFLGRMRKTTTNRSHQTVMAKIQKMHAPDTTSITARV
jgi:hypothetical protein